jgi:acyl carrier protein
LADQGKIEEGVLEVVREMLKELSADRAISGINLDSKIDLDLGLDSLSRVELMTRLERKFSVHLPDGAVTQASNLHDLVSAVGGPQAGKTASPASHVQAAGVDKSTDGVFPADAGTLNAVLAFRAEKTPDAVHMIFRQEDESEKKITYKELYERSGAMAAGLQKRGLARGETVAIMLPTCEEFFHSFLGILLAGGVPVPIYPPDKVEHIEDYAKKQSTVLKSAEVRFMITFARVETLAKAMAQTVPSLQEVSDAAAFTIPGAGVPSVAVDPKDLAFIQYTSGSTGDPKGVALTHANLISNIKSFGAAVDLKNTDLTVSWLPLYHDMGLIGAWLGALCWGIPVVIMSPLAFLARPERWLWAIHAHRATISGAPNFAYELCTKNIPDQALEGLDLSSLRISFSGAEPVSPETIEAFTARFGKYGLKPGVIAPSYGLAENTLVVSIPPPDRPPRFDVISRESFERDRKAVPAGKEEKSPLRLPSCGKPIPETSIRFVDDDGKVLAGERLEGRLQFQGPSAMAGYYRNKEATEATIKDGWVDSGDLGYMADGEIFISGRKKDLIIRGGRKLAPQEIEDIAGEVSGIRKTFVAAFGLSDQATGTEQIVVVAETAEKDTAAREKIAAEITAAVARVVGIPPDVIRLVPPDTVPKTSSGKIRRGECRTLYVSGRLGTVASGKTQVYRVLAGGGARSAGRLAGKAVHLVYGLWAAVWTALFAVVYFALAILAPRGPWGQKLVRNILPFWSRIVTLLLGIIILTRGRKNLKDKKGMMVVCNHASFGDGPVVAAAIGRGLVFLYGQKFTKWPLLKTVLRKGGNLDVDRSSKDRAEKIKEIEEVVKGGSAVLIFPEGTITRTTGLRPFSLGAFKVAAETGAPLVPVAMKGVRGILRDGDWIPRPGVIRVTIGEPIIPKGNDWNEAVRLRDAAKVFIAANCGEPVLDLIEAGPPKD